MEDKEKGFYFFLSKDLKEIKEYSKKGKFLKKYKFNRAKVDERTRIGIFCGFISGGSSLSKIATGVDWRFSEQEFLMLVDKNKEYKEMYSSAYKRRISFLCESLVEVSDVPTLKAKELVVKILKEGSKINQDIEKESKEDEESFEHRTWKDTDKKDAVRDIAVILAENEKSYGDEN